MWYLLSLRRRLVIMQQAPFRLLRMTWALGAATPRGNVGRMSWFGTGGGVGRTRELRCSAGSPPPRVNLYGLSDVALKGLLKDWQQPAFRAKQVRQWVYEKGSTSYDSMMNLPKDLRTKLSEHTTLGELRIAQEQLSKDGTQKRLWECADGSLIESVLMPYDTKRRTACISSQAWRAWRAWQGMEGMEGMAGHGRAWRDLPSIGSLPREGAVLTVMDRPSSLLANRWGVRWAAPFVRPARWVSSVTSPRLRFSSRRRGLPRSCNRVASACPTSCEPDPHSPPALLLASNTRLASPLTSPRALLRALLRAQVHGDG